MARLPRELRPLRELAFDLSWVWQPEVRALFAAIDPSLGSDPRLALELVSGARLAEVAKDPTFIEWLASIIRERRATRAAPTWLQRNHPGVQGLVVAYVSAEFGIAECLPFYAGGLGVLAGDLLKAGSHLGVPLVGVSLLYRQGFFRQQVGPDGWQRERYPCAATELMPVRPRLRRDGTPVMVGLPLPGRRVEVLVWEARVGRSVLLLLDSNLPQNTPADRDITRELYGEDREERLMQEMLLGIGGWRALEASGYRPAVLHMNEGHAAFAAVERARAFRGEYEAARLATAPSNVFTTHTPLGAAFDTFDPGLARWLLGAYAEEAGLAVEDLLDLGRVHPGDRDEPFAVVPLAVRHAGAINGVSRIHADVSRRIFWPLFPRVPDAEVPVGAVTNGVDAASWMGAPMADIWRRCGWSPEGGFPAETGLDRVSDEDLAMARSAQRRDLVAYARRRLRRQLGARGLDAAAVALADTVLDPTVLTLGFARRFTEYKRPTLLFRDGERLRRLLLDPARPVQLVLAGKAHPADGIGKGLIRDVLAFAADPAVRRRVVFLEDDDLEVTGHLVAGVDVWINSPRRPLEACGTSGMKVLANGGINCSVRDGWWAEAYAASAGWAFGDGEPVDDARDADELYRCLESAIVPSFYGSGGDWLARVRASMALAPRFDTMRALREYLERYYLPAFERAGRTSADEVAAWAALLRRGWAAVRVLGRADDGSGRIEATVRLGEIPPDAVRVQAYADHPTTVVGMSLSAAGDGGCWRAAATVPPGRPTVDYTVRVIPHHPDVPWPALLPLVAWER
jgi:starch phosphorylase